ncbi:putative ABC transporter ATP-binding protein [Candidatus Vecturithrix granuli]|uniref:Putative ABC transporter ATP-binding protein n=1 Tax=Vecturithrix granuli TaxID=1499967 RepID=A0A081BW05_VECG1|nr:putative ABC transporter ATP-binding protein [Candidatus Vecturithrix granuli]
MIGRRIKELLFAEENPVGRYITINGVSFQVVGVFNLRKVGDQGRDPTELIHVPLLTFQQVFDYGENIGWLGICVKKHVSASEVEIRFKNLLKRRHKVAPEDERGIGSWNAEKLFQKIQGLFYMLAFFIWLVGTGTIIAGIVGVSNIMLIIVKERTCEIGVRKALGATPFSIVSLILQEAVFITAVSGYMGLVAGVGAIEGIGYIMDRFHLQNEVFTNPEIDFQMAITAAILLVITGAFAGLIPARSAAKINPIEALRSE